MNDRRIFLLIATAVFVYVALRAVLVPVTHDEARTFFVYVQTSSFLPYHSHWDAGNHFLSTALAWVSWSLFGMAPWALRLFSVLAFVPYALYVRQVGLFVNDRLVRWCLWSTLLLLPWVVEFFALFRGYGLAMAFLLMALVHFVRYVRDQRILDLLAVLFAMACAVYAQLSFLILFAATLMALLPLIWKGRKRGQWVFACVSWVILGVLPLWYAAGIGTELKAKGLLYYGTADGLYSGTLVTLSTLVFGTAGPYRWYLMMITALFLASIAAALILMVRRGRGALTDPLIIVAGFLLFDLLGRKVMAVGAGTLYPMDRTVMHYVPLMALLLAFSADRMTAFRPDLRYASLVLLLFPLHALLKLNLTRTVQWPEEAVSMNVLKVAEEKQRAAGRRLSLGGYAQMPAVWEYAATLHHMDLPSMSPLGFPQPICDLLLIDTTYFETPQGFHTIAVAEAGQQVLKERDVPLELELFLDSTFQRPMDSSEFRGIWEPRNDRVRGRGYFVEIDLHFGIVQYPLAGQLLLEGKNQKEEYEFFDQVELRSNLVDQEKGVMHIMRRLPVINEQVEKVACYLYDPNKGPLEIKRAVVKAYVVKEP